MTYTDSLENKKSYTKKKKNKYTDKAWKQTKTKQK